MSMTPQDYRDLLERLEWTGSREGPGDGPMDSGPGRHYPACPYCGQLKPSIASKSQFVDTAIGHLESCKLAIALAHKQPQST